MLDISRTHGKNSTIRSSSLSSSSSELANALLNRCSAVPYRELQNICIKLHKTRKISDIAMLQFVSPKQRTNMFLTGGKIQSASWCSRYVLEVSSRRQVLRQWRSYLRSVSLSVAPQSCRVLMIGDGDRYTSVGSRAFRDWQHIMKSQDIYHHHIIACCNSSTKDKTSG